jgi:hypothetical protein
VLVGRQLEARISPKGRLSIINLGANVPSDAINVSPGEALLTSLLPRLRRFLVTQEAVYEFVPKTTTSLNKKSCDLFEDRILVSNSEALAAAPAAASSKLSSSNV